MPVDCIYEGDRMLYIHPDECVDCGACEPVCPVEAIFYEDDVPAQWKDFTPTNAAFFTEGDDPLGSPGGAAKVGPQVRDTELRGQLHTDGIAAGQDQGPGAASRSGAPCRLGLSGLVCTTGASRGGGARRPPAGPGPCRAAAACATR